ncbi:MAG: apolipoprotein N-acyltransferase [Elusimicrobia bacterium]|nr:apolipoprotein N-acyltransferase [Elusimicrobiota bacterium]
MAAAAAGAANIAASALRLRRARAPGGDAGGGRQRAAVIVAAKGASPALSRSLASLLCQDYPAAYELHIVVPSRDDPAWPLAEAAITGRHAAEATLWCSEAVPETCSEKILNLLYAIERLGPAPEVLVFADSDQLFHPRWLSMLVRALEDPTVGLATAHGVVHLASRPGLVALLQHAWEAAGLPWLELTGSPSGNSLALRREDFRSMDVGRLWIRSIATDFPLAHAVRASGRRVLFVPKAAPVSLGGGGLEQLLRGTGKWMLYFRILRPSLWAAAVLLTALRIYLYARAGAAGAWELAAWMASLDTAALAITMWGLEKHHDERFPDLPRRRRAPAWLGAAAAAPLLPLVHAADTVSSLSCRTVLWGGWRYLLAGPREVSASAPASRPAFGPAQALLMAASGAVIGLSYHPGAWGLLAWVGFVPLLLSCRGDGMGTASLKGWVFGTAAWGVGMCWLPDSLGRFFGLPPVSAWAAFFVAAVAHGFAATGLGAACAAAPSVLGRFGLRPDTALLLAAPAALVAMEGFAPSLFPVTFAKTQVFHLPLIQSAELGGPAVVSWLVMSFNAALALALGGGDSQRGRMLVACAAAAVLVNEGYGLARIAAVDAAGAAARADGRTLVVAALQGLVPNKAGPHPGFEPEKHSVYAGLTAAALTGTPAELVVWPESAYGRTLQEDPEVPGGMKAFSDRLASDLPAPVETLLGTREHLLTPGRLPGRMRSRRYNTAVLAGASKEVRGIYRKRLLFPFGEYIPHPEFFGGLGRRFSQIDRLSNGPREPLPMVTGGGTRLGVLVCYEDFSPDLAREFAAASADLLLNITNEIWFSGSAPQQHLEYSSLRAVETRKSVVRAANMGISAIVDPVGRVVSSLPCGQRGLLKASVVLLPGRTPYSAAGPLLPRAALAVSLFVLVLDILGPSPRRLPLVGAILAWPARRRARADASALAPLLPAGGRILHLGSGDGLLSEALLSAGFWVLPTDSVDRSLSEWLPPLIASGPAAWMQHGPFDAALATCGRYPALAEAAFSAPSVVVLCSGPDRVALDEAARKAGLALRRAADLSGGRTAFFVETTGASVSTHVRMSPNP